MGEGRTEPKVSTVDSTPSVNRCAEMRRKTYTVVQKREDGWRGENRTQSVNRCAEMRRNMYTVVQKHGGAPSVESEAAV